MSDVEELQKKRDELNLSVKNNIEAIRSKIAELKSLNGSVKKLKEERDSKNRIVAEFRKKRDLLNSEGKKLLDELKKVDVRLKKFPSRDTPIDALRKKRDELDWKIQTEHHSIKKDEDLRDSLEEIEAEIASEDKRASLLSERSKIQKEIGRLRGDAETLHSLIVDNSQSAKSTHEHLISIYAKIKALRAEIEPVSKQIRALKEEANDAHASLLAAKKSARESMASFKKARARQGEEKLRLRAKELLRGFQEGKKLSTEEILIIQRYG